MLGSYERAAIKDVQGLSITCFCGEGTHVYQEIEWLGGSLEMPICQTISFKHSARSH